MIAVGGFLAGRASRKALLCPASLLVVVTAVGCAPVAPPTETTDGPVAASTLEDRLAGASVGQLVIERNGADELVMVIGTFPVPAEIPVDPVARGDWFLDSFGDELGVDDAQTDVEVVRVVEREAAGDTTGDAVVTYERRVDGVRVFGAEFKVEVDDDGTIRSLIAQVPQDLEGFPTRPVVSEEAAVEIARAEITARGLARAELEESELVILNAGLFDGSARPSALAYRISFVAQTTLANPNLFVDAASGAVLEFGFDAVRSERDRRTYDVENRDQAKLIESGARTLLLDEEGPIEGVEQDAEGTAAHEHVGDAWTFYDEGFGHHGHDGAGAENVTYVHFGDEAYNAFWWRGAIWFEDGQVSRETTFHEFTHAVGEGLAGFVYAGESGALDESFSDVMSALGNPNGQQWWYGEAEADGPTRRLDAPTLVTYDLGDGPVPYPNHLDDEYTGDLDEGGVHINSSIVNHAAYLIAVGDTHVGSNVAVPGIGVEKAGQIYYRALGYLTSGATFEYARLALRRAALEFAEDETFGITHADCGSVLMGYAAVGIGELDTDLDCFDDAADNCPEVANPDQDPAACGADTEESPAEEMETPACFGVEATCSGSGPTFDDECCGDLICVTGICQAPEGGRERATCDRDENHCALGLDCRPVGEAEVAPTCCARDEQYCEAKEDCCGFMDCVSNRCVGQPTGEMCVIGDCVGASYCNDGTCT